MPILIRPVREQLEHDRVIRQLQAKWKRKFDVQINVGEEKNASVKVGTNVFYPDVVLSSLATPRRLQGVVEVETSESVNNLEAMAQWANFAKTKVPFQLYVPTGSYDIARRLCEEHQVVPAELWTFIQIGEQIRFTLAQKNASTEPPRAEKPEKPAKVEKPARPVKAKPKPRAEKPKAGVKARPSAPAKGVRPARAAAKGAKPARQAATRAAGARTPARKAVSRKATAPRPRPAATRNQKRR